MFDVVILAALCPQTLALQLPYIPNWQGRTAFASCHNGHNAISTPAVLLNSFTTFA